MKTKFIKKITAAIMTITLCISLTACSNINSSSDAYNSVNNYFEQHKDSLTAEALDWISTGDGNVKATHKYEIWVFSYDNADIAVFDFKNGWCSKISYGLYYSTSDHPANISTYNYDLKEADNGWFAEETEKYYPYYTEKLMDNWYFYYIGNNSNN